MSKKVHTAPAKRIVRSVSQTSQSRLKISGRGKANRVKKNLQGSIWDGSVDQLIQASRVGLQYRVFEKLEPKIGFTRSEWSTYLHVSEKTLGRYHKLRKPFDSLQSERILEIARLYEEGLDLFGTSENFNRWLSAENLALGRITPKSLLDTSTGIGIVRDALIAIAQGVFA